MRNKRLFYNTVTALILQIVTIIGGFIVPRLILSAYGSGINGLVNSITQFISIISFLDMGVGAVIQSALYKPIANNDLVLISSIVTSANHFYKRIAQILIVYIVVLCIIYPTIISRDFGAIYTITLIIAISISAFAQYYFGIVDMLFVIAAQRGYIQYSIQIISVVFNTIAVAVLIYFNASIQMVKLITSVVFLVRPLILRLYVNKKYRINRKIKIESEPIKQKWNGLAQHVANVVLDSTDIMVLTVFSTLENVSVYSVYHLVVYGVKQLFTMTTNGIQSFWGDMWAREEIEQLDESFNRIEWIIHNSVMIVFGCTCVLIVPFVSIYTKGVLDVNYIVHDFAILITIAHGMHCLRLPYHTLIKAVGHYKETQKNYIVAASMNILISIIVVRKFGLVGVAVGTLVAMIYQTFWMVWYDYRFILKKCYLFTIRLFVSDILIAVVGYFFSTFLKFNIGSYFDWLSMAIVEVFIWIFISLVINLGINKKYLKWLFIKVAKKRKR